MRCAGGHAAASTQDPRKAQVWRQNSTEGAIRSQIRSPKHFTLQKDQELRGEHYFGTEFSTSPSIDRNPSLTLHTAAVFVSLRKHPHRLIRTRERKTALERTSIANAGCLPPPATRRRASTHRPSAPSSSIIWRRIKTPSGQAAQETDSEASKHTSAPSTPPRAKSCRDPAGEGPSNRGGEHVETWGRATVPQTPSRQGTGHLPGSENLVLQPRQHRPAGQGFGARWDTD